MDRSSEVHECTLTFDIAGSRVALGWPLQLGSRQGMAWPAVSMRVLGR